MRVFGEFDGFHRASADLRQAWQGRLIKFKPCDLICLVTMALRDVFQLHMADRLAVVQHCEIPKFRIVSAAGDVLNPRLSQAFAAPAKRAVAETCFEQFLDQGVSAIKPLCTSRAQGGVDRVAEDFAAGVAHLRRRGMDDCDCGGDIGVCWREGGDGLGEAGVTGHRRATPGIPLLGA
ncbi:MAG: hypothetical protein ACR652_15075 [Methylocystis sp.]|uniref:hypothetical protein n=1 Tax=Methylocystis sp. TaxID=1911079 RepID=UPI003DA27D5F